MARTNSELKETIRHLSAKEKLTLDEIRRLEEAEKELEINRIVEFLALVATGYWLGTWLYEKLERVLQEAIEEVKDG